MKNEEFVKTDPVGFTKKVKSTFDPTPHFAVGMVTVGGNTVGIIHVVQHASRPVIATRQECPQERAPFMGFSKRSFTPRWRRGPDLALLGKPHLTCLGLTPAHLTGRVAIHRPKFTAFIKAEVDRYAAVAKIAGVEPD